jgi:hypothetical protein
MPVYGSGAVVWSLFLLCGTHTGRFQAETPLILMFKFPEPALYFIGGILEKLAEPEISSVEQAAFYVLSAHPEHQEAAERWVEADPKHMKAFRKFLKANRYYKNLMEDGAEIHGGNLTG